MFTSLVWPFHRVGTDIFNVKPKAEEADSWWLLPPNNLWIQRIPECTSLSSWVATWGQQKKRAVDYVNNQKLQRNAPIDLDSYLCHLVHVCLIYANGLYKLFESPLRLTEITEGDSCVRIRRTGSEKASLCDGSGGALFGVAWWLKNNRTCLCACYK